MLLLALPAFDDNLIWMLHDGHHALVVDPGAAAPVIEALQREGLQLCGILVTHHHGDHVGGLAELLPWLQGPVFAPAREAMPVATTPVQQGQALSLPGWPALRITALDVPGHTAGHVAYTVDDGSTGRPGWLFCGDTLFSGGCGRVFEGTPAQMQASLARLSALPGDTAVCCAHEYTLPNLRFAREVEPGNAALAEYQAHCQGLRAQGRWTLPSSIATERQINPFLRWAEPAVIAAARAQGAAASDAVSVFTALREWKNRFR